MNSEIPLVAAKPLRAGQAVAIDANGLVHPLGEVSRFDLNLKPQDSQWSDSDADPLKDLEAFQHNKSITVSARFAVNPAVAEVIHRFLLNRARNGKLSRNDRRRVKAQAARVARQRRKRK
ncbi:MAG: hypothetical protein ACRDAM_13870 [Casimicrobium sp.]